MNAYMYSYTAFLITLDDTLITVDLFSHFEVKMIKQKSQKSKQCLNLKSCSFLSLQITEKISACESCKWFKHIFEKKKYRTILSV